MRLWIRWVAANAAGELAGLGLVFAGGVAIFGGQTRTAIATTLLLAALHRAGRDFRTELA
ncbi:MAG: hypothetical protein ACXWH1_12290 [Thermoanaerobaculia bacterium]